MLPAYKITFTDNSTISTNMAAHVTLDDAKAYYLGQWFDVGAYPVENMQMAIGVEAI